VIHKSNEGCAEAINDGLKISTGDYIIILGSDDFLEVETCEMLNKIVEVNPNIDVVTTNIKIIDQGRIKLEYFTTEENKLMDGYNFLKCQLLNNTFTTHSQRLVCRRTFLIDNNLFFKKEYRYGEDNLWVPRVLLHSKIIYVSDYCLYNYNSIPNSKSRLKKYDIRAVNMLPLYKELSNIYNDVTDEELKTLLFDRLIYEYLLSYFLGKLYKKEYSSFVDVNFLKGKPCLKRNKLKLSLFHCNSNIYCYILSVYSLYIKTKQLLFRRG